MPEVLTRLLGWKSLVWVGKILIRAMDGDELAHRLKGILAGLVERSLSVAAQNVVFFRDAIKWRERL